MEVRPHVSTAPAARRADEARLDVRQPRLIGPAVGAQGREMATVVVGAIDQDAVHAHLAHVLEGDLLGPHAAYPSAALSPLQIVNLGGAIGAGLLGVVGAERSAVAGKPDLPYASAEPLLLTRT